MAKAGALSLTSVTEIRTTDVPTWLGSTGPQRERERQTDRQTDGEREREREGVGEREGGTERDLDVSRDRFREQSNSFFFCLEKIREVGTLQLIYPLGQTVYTVLPLLEAFQMKV